MRNVSFLRDHWGWLPAGAAPWTTSVAVQAPWPRTCLPAAAVGVIFLSTLEWKSAAVAWIAIAAMALMAWPLRRLSAMADPGSTWVQTTSGEVACLRATHNVNSTPPGPAMLVRPGPDATLLDFPRSAAAVRAANALLTASGSGPDFPSWDPIGCLPSGIEVDYDEELPPSRRSTPLKWLVVTGGDGAFALDTSLPFWPDDSAKVEAKRQKVLAGLVAATGSPAPSQRRGLGIPDVVAVTAADVRAFARSGLAPAYRLEAAFRDVALESDPRVSLAALRGWPSRVDDLAPDSDADVLALLREDLKAQAQRDAAWESAHEIAEPLAGAWEEWWAARLDTGVEVRPGRPQEGLSQTGKAALMLAATASDLTDDPLRAAATGLGVPAQPAATWVTWPRGHFAARLGDRLLLGGVLAVPIILYGVRHP